jgi:hypothetical protein
MRGRICVTTWTTLKIGTVGNVSSRGGLSGRLIPRAIHDWAGRSRRKNRGVHHGLVSRIPNTHIAPVRAPLKAPRATFLLADSAGRLAVALPTDGSVAACTLRDVFVSGFEISIATAAMTPALCALAPGHAEIADALVTVMAVFRPRPAIHVQARRAQLMAAVQRRLRREYGCRRRTGWENSRVIAFATPTNRHRLTHHGGFTPVTVFHAVGQLLHPLVRIDRRVSQYPMYLWLLVKVRAYRKAQGDEAGDRRLPGKPVTPGAGLEQFDLCGQLLSRHAGDILSLVQTQMLDNLNGKSSLRITLEYLHLSCTDLHSPYYIACKCPISRSTECSSVGRRM